MEPWLPSVTPSLTCLHRHPNYQLSPNSLIQSAQMSHSFLPPAPSISHQCSSAEAEGTSAELHGLMTHHTDNDRPRVQLQNQHLSSQTHSSTIEVAHSDLLRCYPAAACSFLKSYNVILSFPNCYLNLKCGTSVHALQREKSEFWLKRTCSLVLQSGLNMLHYPNRFKLPALNNNSL